MSYQHDGWDGVDDEWERRFRDFVTEQHDLWFCRHDIDGTIDEIRHHADGVCYQLSAWYEVEIDPPTNDVDTYGEVRLFQQGRLVATEDALEKLDAHTQTEREHEAAERWRMR